MMDRGQLGALNYRMTFPGQQAQRGQMAPPEQGSGFDHELPNNLATRQGKLNNLLQNYNLLKGVISELERSGEVWDRPDLSQPDGGLAYQTYLAAAANVQYATQELANELKAEEQLRPLEATGKIRYNKDIDFQNDMYASNPNNYYSTDPLPFVDEANRRLNTPTYTRGDQTNFNRSYYNPSIQQIDQMVANGQMGQEEAAFQKAALQPNVAQTAYQQLIPRSGGRGGRGLTPEDLSARAELIKQVKRGIVTNDQTPINILKLAPGVEDVGYINTGDKVGLEVYFKGQDSPAFIDLSQGAGEGDINALLNKIEGQRNVPNEAVFNFDTKVQIPQSNARPIIDSIKSKFKGIADDPASAINELPKLQELASSGDLYTTTGEPVASIDVNETWWGPNEIVITYFKSKNGKVDYGKTAKKKLTDPNEIDAFLEANANEIAPAFGGGFGEQTVTPEQQKAIDLINKYRK